MTARDDVEPAAGGGARMFPEHPWNALPADALAEAEAIVETAARRLAADNGPPRDVELARRHLREHLPSGSYWVYACSTHSVAMLATLEEMERVRILGFVDRNAPSIAVFHGHPVVTPEEVAGLDRNPILVAHARNEAEFADHLRACGIGEDRIVRLYGDPVYGRETIEAYAARLVERFPGPYDTVIATDLAVVIDDFDLAKVYDRASTLVVHYGDPGRYASNAFDVADVGGSYECLLRVLSMYDPKTVYLRTFFDEGSLSHSIRKRHPRAVLIHEMFDMAIVFPDEVLRTWNRWSDDKIAALRLTEWCSLRDSDMIVSKRGGPCWDKITGDASAKTVTFFSRVVDGDPGAAEADETPAPVVAPGLDPVRIVYAGYLPPNPRHVGGYYDLYPCFEKLTADGQFLVDIHNAGHHPINDALYAGYLSRQDGGRINYHRASEYRDLVRLLRRYHFGWLYNERSDIYIHDAAVTIPGRITGYLSAGLPVIIDDEFDFLAGLVRRFNAGIVVPEGRTELIPELIRTADYPSLKAGAKELLRHMAAQNATALHRLRQLKGAGPDRDSRK